MSIPRNPCLLLLLLLLLLSLSSAHFSPTDNYLFDCGSGSRPATLHDGRSFVSDSSEPTFCVNLHSDAPDISLSDPNPNPNLSPLYHTARVLSKPSSYELCIESSGTHLIRLHFYPFSTPSYNLSSARFHVAVDDFVLLYDFAVANATNSPQIREYFVNFDTDKPINQADLTFVPAGPDTFAFVNAIEVVSSPLDLVADAARLVSFDKVGVSKLALQTAYRVNVGGPEVTPFSDAFWRDWVPDSGFLVSNSSSKTVSFSGRIKYRKGGASGEVTPAPDSVYRSARVSSSNMTWGFAVDLGYTYLVRMHSFSVLNLNAYVDGYAAYQDFDISNATGQIMASPYYVDFVVDVGGSGVLNVGIGPSSKFSDPSDVGGLLNGLEIMKMNNTVGSLDGESSVDSVQGSLGSYGLSVSLLLCGLAVVSFCVVVFTLAWSCRPVELSKVAGGCFRR